MIILIYIFILYYFIIDLFKNSLNNWIIWIWQRFNWYQLLFSLKIVNNVQCGYNKWLSSAVTTFVIIKKSSNTLYNIYRIYIICSPTHLPPNPLARFASLEGLPTSYLVDSLPWAVTALEKYQIINKNINVIKLIDYLMIVQCGYSTGQSLNC